MSGEKQDHPELDPFAPMVQLTESWMKAWSSAMSDVATSEAFATATGQQVEGVLEATKLIRQQMKVSMEQALEQMNVPTRDQVLGLAERLTNLEMRLDDLEAKADESLDRLKSIQAALRDEA